MSNEKRSYVIVMHSAQQAIVVDLTPEQFREKVSMTIQSYLATGRTVERTRELMHERLEWARAVKMILPGETEPVPHERLTEFETETLRQLGTGEYTGLAAATPPATLH